MVDVPDGLDDITEVIIYGVESEQIEEENDAYKDMKEELGLDKQISIYLMGNRESRLTFNRSSRHCQGGGGRHVRADALLLPPQHV